MPVHKKHKETTLNPENDSPPRVMGLLSKNKGFTLAIIGVIIIILILVLSYLMPVDSIEQQQKLYSASELYATNQSDFNSYLANIEEEQNTVQESTLDEAFLASTKKDVEMLIQKENELYDYSNAQDIYPKEIAFTLFAQIIIQVNQDSLFQVGEMDYDTEIQKAIDFELSTPALLTEEDLNLAFTTQKEREIYFTTLERLFNEYITSKKSLINSGILKEQKYVEAKKLIWLNYALQNE